MLVIQHIWHRWDKASRGADGCQRPILARAYALPAMQQVTNAQQQALVHDVSSDLWGPPDVVEKRGVVSHDEWVASVPALDWRVRDRAVEISLSNPSRWRLQTKWPAWLPSPLFVLASGETARIEWNGRFRRSMGGSNRASYYEQHAYWLAVTDTPHERLFLDATPRKDLDYTRHIY